MKTTTVKHAAGKARVAIPLLAILLAVGPVPAEAGLLDTVNSKVTTILNKVKTVVSNTGGLGEFIATMRDIRDNLGGGMIDDLRDSIGETRDMLQFIKDRRDSAGQTSQYPSLPNLVRSLDGVIDVIADRDEPGGALERISALLDVIPDRALAPVARAVSKAGVDGEFVEKIDQMSYDLVELKQVVIETEAELAIEYLQAELMNTPDDEHLSDIFQCRIHDSGRLIRLHRAAKNVRKRAETMKVLGKLIEVVDKTVEIEKGIGIWGWVSAKIKVEKGATLGKLLGIVGDGALVVVGSANKIIDPCIKQKLEQIALVSNG